MNDGTSVVKVPTRLRSAIRNFVALSFLVSWQFFNDYHKILGTLSLDHVSSTQWIHIVEWIAPFVKQIADWRVKEARTEAIQRGDQSSFHIQFGGFYLTRGIPTTAQLPFTMARMGKLLPWRPGHLMLRYPAIEKSSHFRCREK